MKRSKMNLKVYYKQLNLVSCCLSNGIHWVHFRKKGGGVFGFLYIFLQKVFFRLFFSFLITDDVPLRFST